MTANVPSSRKKSSVKELSLLRARLEEATPFEMGMTEYEGETWQLMIALSTDPVSNVPEKSSRYSWSGHAVKTEKWLFLNVELGEQTKSKWSFGFDCNEPEALVFLRQLLREGRLIVGFPGPSLGTRFDRVGEKMVKNIGPKMESYIPRWKNEFNK